MVHKGFEYIENGNVGYYVIPSFVERGLVRHCFTTRIGGVSSDECHSLNLGLKRKDSKENVFENFRRVCRCIGVDPQSLVFSDQVHCDRIHTVTHEDKGKGLYRESDIHGKDGLITNQHDIPLVTFYADCVPLFFLILSIKPLVPAMPAGVAR